MAQTASASKPALCHIHKLDDELIAEVSASFFALILADSLLNITYCCIPRFTQVLGCVSVPEVLALSRTCKALRHTATHNEGVWANLCRTVWCIEENQHTAPAAADAK
jgi:hypothetical protein